MRKQLNFRPFQYIHILLGKRIYYFIGLVFVFCLRISFIIIQFNFVTVCIRIVFQFACNVK